MGRYSFVGLAAETVIKVNDYDVSIEKKWETAQAI